MDRLKEYLVTTDNQFGFKRKHGTDLCIYQVKSSLLYCQFFHMYSTYIQRIEIALLSDPWCIQLTLNTDSRRSNTDKYSLNICTYKLYRYANEDIVEK